MIRVVEELLRIVAYGGFGAVFGFALCSWVNDQHRLTTSILNESEKDMPTRRPFLSAASLQSFVVILVMVALLLTGLVWISTGRENAAQDERDCKTVAKIAETLQGRTKTYAEQAIAERRLWQDIRDILAVGEGPASDAAVRSVDEYLQAQGRYVDHLANNPYPQDVPEDC